MLHRAPHKLLQPRSMGFLYNLCAMHFLKTFPNPAGLGLPAAALAFSGGCATSEVNPVSGKKQPVGFSWQEERQLGAASDKDVIQEMGLYEDQQVQAYVSELG